MLTLLSWFARFPFIQTFTEGTMFEWTYECEQAIIHVKQALSQPPVLSRSDANEVLYLYMAIAAEAVNAALIRETQEGQ